MLEVWDPAMPLRERAAGKGRHEATGTGTGYRSIRSPRCTTSVLRVSRAVAVSA
jgi:hypothetical protein